MANHFAEHGTDKRKGVLPKFHSLLGSVVFAFTFSFHFRNRNRKCSWIHKTRVRQCLAHNGLNMLENDSLSFHFAILHISAPLLDEYEMCLFGIIILRWVISVCAGHWNYSCAQRLEFRLLFI